jgi:hypothetical protein
VYLTMPGDVQRASPPPAGYGRCWAHITGCDGLCRQPVEVRDPVTGQSVRIAPTGQGADFHQCGDPAVDDLGLCEHHRREILGAAS